MTYASRSIGVALCGCAVIVSVAIAGQPPGAIEEEMMTAQNDGPRNVMPPPRADFEEGQEQLIRREFDLTLAKGSDDALRQFAARFPGHPLALRAEAMLKQRAEANPQTPPSPN